MNNTFFSNFYARGTNQSLKPIFLNVRQVGNCTKNLVSVLHVTLNHVFRPEPQRDALFFSLLETGAKRNSASQMSVMFPSMLCLQIKGSKLIFSSCFFFSSTN